MLTFSWLDIFFQIVQRKLLTEMNKENNNRRNGQYRRNYRNRNDNKPKNNDKDPVAGPSSAENGRKNHNNNFEATKPIGFKTLEAVLDKVENESELISKLASEANGFLLLLNKESIRPDFMCLILSALAKASECSTELVTTQLLVHFYMKIIPKLNSKANFHRELKLFIANLSNYCAIYETRRQQYVKAVEDLLTFLRRLQLTSYQKSLNAVRDLMQPITAQIEYLNRKGNTMSDKIVETMERLNESMENFEQMKEETEKTEVLLEPPEDFREIGIYPDTFDILSNHEPFIRASIVEGKYAGGIDHYLDVQFRLLREDFVRPLRSGITQYRQIRDNPEKMAKIKFRINDLNIYQNVQIYGSKMMHNDQVHFCRFDSAPFRKLRWQVKNISIIFLCNFFLICLKSNANSTINE